jgi:uncharacterized metal-binding protein YceD (DUF177 family)
MKISVTRLFGADADPIEYECDVAPGGELKDRYPHGVRFAALIRPISHEVFVEGTIEGRESETCARCLEEFSRDVRVPIAEAYSEDVPASDALISDIAPLVNREIDIDELVSQMLVVDEPIAAVCAPRCKGICPICGVNRNVQSCSCTAATIDPRLAGLARLLEERGTE